MAWTLCRTRSVLVASQDYLQRRGTPATPQDLALHDCLYYPRAQAVPSWHFEAPDAPRVPASRVSLQVAGPFAANNSEALRDAAVAGLGIALMPDFSAQSALREGRLVEVLPRWQSVDAFAGQLFAIRPYAAQVPRAVAAFVDWLRVELAGGFAV